ncbi:chord-domain-containing protein [Syncephalastrum racemosum]|uniref:Chord-domain-containing protein n=1 Tax=Syncephalastrum racemosum TaxID=13706 RepID=A0A1X2HDF1_SYNRA|nr:chord-domain-containing protein [Syncephalastrum racemosum]
MPICTHKGCGKEFNEQSNADDACQFHSGSPVFHEGLKGWSCCNKRVTEFDEFLKIPGCTFGQHTTEKQTEPQAAKPAAAPQATSVNKDGVEVYGTAAPAAAAASTAASSAAKPTASSTAEELEQEEDDLSVPVTPGTTCKRRGCGKTYVDDATSRGTGSEAVCVHHPGAPVFHEGSKGWSCCKRRVLEFDEFLKIAGCKEGNHLFVGSNKEELIDCRKDWYQTQTNVILSIFAKDKLDTQVNFETRSVSIDIKIKNNKRYKKTFALFHDIDPENSKFTALTTKVEINLKKTSGVSWADLEPTDVKTWTTFGVTGGGGSVGATEVSSK